MFELGRCACVAGQSRGKYGDSGYARMTAFGYVRDTVNREQNDKVAGRQ